MSANLPATANPILTDYYENESARNQIGMEMMIRNILRQIMEDSRGATAVEYGLLAGLIVISAMVGITGLANEVNSMWTRVSTTISSGISGA